MIAAEFRYLRDMFVVLGAVAVVFVAGAGIAVFGHLTGGAVLVIYGFLLITACCGAAYLYLHRLRSRLRAGQPVAEIFGDTNRPKARIVPVAIDIVVGIWLSWAIGSGIWGKLHHAVVSNDSLIINGFIGAVWIITSVRRARNVSPIDSARFAQFQAAYAAPTRESRRRLIAPLRNRGLGRLALLTAMPIAMALLLPHVGIGLALLEAFVGTTTLFLILHKTVGL